MFFYGTREQHVFPSSASSSMIYTRALGNHQFRTAAGLFSAAGLIRTTAGIHEEREAAAKKKSTAQCKFAELFYNHPN
uniref:ATP synthase subunit e, mitochondrial n=1 Tax=Angiostrongylus cantonensis TaxID=6313 RepID=A0A0K0DQF9_ANGCA